MRLKDKVALITGATSGMGRAAAELFAQEGANVVLFARRAELGAEIVEGIKADGGEATFVQGDVSIAEDAQHAVQVTVERYGKLDILFNNAGINMNRNVPPDLEPEEDWQKIIDVNLKGTFLFTKYAVPEMKKAGGGSIINNSSVVDPQATAYLTASYHASKGGVGSMTRQAALAYAPDNIRVNCVLPGSIATEMSRVTWDRLDDPEVVERFSSQQPLRRLGHPMDIAYAALFLASDESAFVTGVSLPVDGGSLVQLS